ncbi:hypothetical protein R5R35_003774 [Gryllus longicercus]|uniref:Uncharacterized protein n=1 Tax=Gryllus longicercus TaxID=2509291 RepID=A0AAN9Z0X9_9ORTH
MQLSRASRFALRLAVTQQPTPVTSAPRDRLTLPLALLLASAGLGLSSFSLKQLLTAPRNSSRGL